ncbi:leucine-rich repeat receptor-like serine/threonine-protein kinase At2g14510 [Argentina anserina]|uniref:leucine-rich repeat receptor-like serine/threonine-protein kinase At2g14510 n=1 Tax=Argentina anserina TaxID=57926 RepID=UPI0021768B79|nr:leucine-rich repeat receptor-like serine/threonine-protein kinase At2g14510 [Potentilla anserina]
MPLLLLLLLSLLPIPISLSQPKGTFIDCGAAVESEIDGRQWLPDSGFLSGAGTSKTLNISGQVPILSTVRSFLNVPGRKYCYNVQVYRGARYMVRTTYFYGGINGPSSPPVFDQIIDGTLWAVVNTTEDYANGMSSYYEGVFLAQSKIMSVCVGSNAYTESDPFISALEFVILHDSLYNSTDFKSNGLSLVARHGFGYNGPIIRYPDDQFDRFWEPFGETKLNDTSDANVSVSGLWNLPPVKVFESELTTNLSQAIELKWPPKEVEDADYYIALYFADSRGRVFDVMVNGVVYYKDLNVTEAGLVIYATKWPLGGRTNVTLSPSLGSVLGPLINAGEAFQVLPLGGRTLTRDVIALEKIKESLENPPPNWNGDPCLPRQYTWTGITCSGVRVISLNLTNMGLSGSLPPNIANMTALSDIWLGNNNLSGPIPDLSSLKILETLHLEDNQFSGVIPSSLGNIDSLRELFLQNNNLTGQVPSNLTGKSGLNLRTSPGNSFSAPPPS